MPTSQTHFVKHAQTIFRVMPTNCLSMLDHFVGLELRGLKCFDSIGEDSRNVSGFGLHVLRLSTETTLN